MLDLGERICCTMHFMFAQSDGKFQETFNGSRQKVIHSHVTLVMALMCYLHVFLLHFNLLYNKYLLLLFLNSNCVSTLSTHEHFQFSFSYFLIICICFEHSLFKFNYSFFFFSFFANTFLFC